MQRHIYIVCVLLLVSGCSGGQSLDQFFNRDTERPVVGGCPEGGGACVRIQFTFGGPKNNKPKEDTDYKNLVFKQDNE